RFSRDWSSDVCSSDLPVPAAGALAHHHLRAAVSAPAGDIAGELRGPGADAAVAGGAGGAGRADLEPAAPDELAAHRVAGRSGDCSGQDSVAAVPACDALCAGAAARRAGPTRLCEATTVS